VIDARERLRVAWRSLDWRTRWLVAGSGAVVLIGLLSSVLYALGIAAVIVAGAGARWLLGSHRWRSPAVVAVCAGGALALGAAFEGSTDPTARLPDPPRSISFHLPPRSDQVAALVALDPGSPDTWLAAGFALPRSEPTDPGVVALERVLLMEPSSSRAALELAQTFLSFGRSSLDEEIAAYYTAIAGYPVPELPRQP
jgi:hypothetical protein